MALEGSVLLRKQSGIYTWNWNGSPQTSQRHQDHYQVLLVGADQAWETQGNTYQSRHIESDNTVPNRDTESC